MTDGVSNEPVIASTPTPISVEPRVAAPAEAAEISRQAEEAKVAATAPKEAPKAEKTEEKAKPLSTREAIRAAAAKVNAEPAKPISVAAKDAEPVAAKEAPAAKTEAKAVEPAKTEPARAEDGKFVSTKAPAAETGAKAEPVKAAPDAPVAAKPAALPSHTAEAPPARFSAAAKEKWAEAPDEVRAEVTRAVTELTKGFEKHRTAAERDSTLAEFHDMAGKSGKALRDVVAQYVGMENQLRADPVKGFELICQNAGISFRDVAAKYLNQTPDQTQSATDATIRDLNAKIAQLEKGLGSIHQERQATQANTTTEMVTKFAAENPRFEELADDIAFFLKTRTKDLAEAYKLAERLNPAPAAQAPAATPAASEAPVRSTPTLVPAASSTDVGSKSIAGTPTAGSDPVRKQPSNSIKEAIRRAQAAAG